MPLIEFIQISNSYSTIEWVSAKLNLFEFFHDHYHFGLLFQQKFCEPRLSYCIIFYDSTPVSTPRVETVKMNNAAMSVSLRIWRTGS